MNSCFGCLNVNHVLCRHFSVVHLRGEESCDMRRRSHPAMFPVTYLVFNTTTYGILSQESTGTLCLARFSPREPPCTFPPAADRLMARCLAPPLSRPPARAPTYHTPPQNSSITLIYPKSSPFSQNP